MIDYFQDKRDKWRFRVVGRNGEKIVTSEAYASKANAKRGVEDMMDASISQEDRS